MDSTKTLVHQVTTFKRRARLGFNTYRGAIRISGNVNVIYSDVAKRLSYAKCDESVIAADMDKATGEVD